MADVNPLETGALQRKAKLQALKNKASQGEGGAKLKFRNYNPQSEELKEKKIPKGKPEDVEPQIEDQLEAAKDSDLGEINLANLAPRKVDWDLKRDIKKKLEKLDRRTQRAIVELLQERLKDSNEDDLASVVATAEKIDTNNTDYDSD